MKQQKDEVEQVNLKKSDLKFSKSVQKRSRKKAECFFSSNRERTKRRRRKRAEEERKSER